jgi:hypothetical protein
LALHKTGKTWYTYISILNSATVNRDLSSPFPSPLAHRQAGTGERDEVRGLDVKEINAFVLAPNWNKVNEKRNH